MSEVAYPFILASARDVHIARGLRRVVTAARLTDLPERVALLLRSARPDAPGVVVGALPFGHLDRFLAVIRQERFVSCYL